MLIATLGAIDANSYVNQAEADLYFADRMHSSAWDALATSDKDKLLITSSRMLDWYIKWKGIKASVEQSMLWPRVGAIRPDGTEIEDDALPPEVKIATYEQALMNIAADKMSDNPLAGISQLKAGPLMIKAASGDPTQSTNSDPISNNIYQIVSDLYSQGGVSVVRLLRA